MVELPEKNLLTALSIQVRFSFSVLSALLGFNCAFVDFISIFVLSALQID